MNGNGYNDLRSSKPVHTDPLRVWERRERTITVLGGIGVVLTAVWAFLWPMAQIDTPLASDPEQDGSIIAQIESKVIDTNALEAHQSDDHTADGMDANADIWDQPDALERFAAVQLWHPQPIPIEGDDDDGGANSKPAPATILPAPKHLELLGIISTPEGTRQAAIYNQKTDQILIVANGETVDHYEITSITQNTVELTDGNRNHQITMESAIG